MQRKILQTIGVAAIAVMCATPFVVSAAPDETATPGTPSGEAGNSGTLPDQMEALGNNFGQGGQEGIQNAQQGLQDVTITNPIGGTPQNPAGVTSIQSFIALVIRAMLGLVGSFALLMFVYGGFLWLTSRGNHEMIAKGSSTMTWAAAGLVLIFSSYAIVSYIFEVLGAA